MKSPAPARVTTKLTLGLSLGPQNVTAVQRLAASVYGYRLVNKFPNDPQAFSQGPLYTDAGCSSRPTRRPEYTGQELYRFPFVHVRGRESPAFRSMAAG